MAKHQSTPVRTVFIKLSSSADISTNLIFLLKAPNAVFALSTLRQCLISQSMRWHVLSVLSLLPAADYFLFLPGQHSHVNENQNNNNKKNWLHLRVLKISSPQHHAHMKPSVFSLYTCKEM